MTFRSLKIALAACIFCSTSLLAGEPARKEKDFLSTIFKNDPAYLFSYFTGNGQDGLHLMYTMDGLIWRTLNDGKPLLKPELGESKLMRDPSIVRDNKGTFHMVWTTGWNDRIIGYASSKDLIQWSEQKALPVMENETEARNAWAPELFFDKISGQFYIVWASTIPGRFPENGKSEDNYNHRLYYTTTTDFKTFAKTKLYYDPGFSVIDACFLKKGGAYFMFLKNETREPVEKNIRFVTSSNMKNFPTTVSDPISGKTWSEGPTAVKIGKYVYVYWDQYRVKKYSGVRCKNPAKPVWEDISGMLQFPAGVRHGTAFKVSDDILTGLQNLTKQAD